MEINVQMMKKGKGDSELCHRDDDEKKHIDLRSNWSNIFKI